MASLYDIIEKWKTVYTSFQGTVYPPSIIKRKASKDNSKDNVRHLMQEFNGLLQEAKKEMQEDDFSFRDHDLNELVNTCVSISKGNCNMDTGIYMMQCEAALMERLKPIVERTQNESEG